MTCCEKCKKDGAHISAKYDGGRVAWYHEACFFIMMTAIMGSLPEPKPDDPTTPE